MRNRHHRGLLSLVDGLVIDRIENAHDVALAIDGMGHEHGRCIEVVERFDEIGFAIAGFSVDQHRISAADGRPHLRKHVLGDHHPAQRLRQCALGQPSLLGTLPANLLDVLSERYRGGTRILAAFEHFPGQCPTRIRQRKDRTHASHAERPFDLDVVLQLQGLHQILNHAESETNGDRKILAIKVTSKVEDLENQAFHAGCRQPGFRQGFRLLRRECEFSGHATHRHIELNLIRPDLEGFE